MHVSCRFLIDDTQSHVEVSARVSFKNECSVRELRALSMVLKRAFRHRVSSVFSKRLHHDSCPQRVVCDKTCQFNITHAFR